jgi:hypothetical protein
MNQLYLSIFEAYCYFPYLKVENIDVNKMLEEARSMLKKEKTFLLRLRQ